MISNKPSAATKSRSNPSAGKRASAMDRYLPTLTEQSKRWLRLVALILGAWALGHLAIMMRSVLTPLVAALAIAYIASPAVTWLETKRCIPRWVSVGLGLGLIGFVVVFLVFAAIAQLIELAGSVEDYSRQGLAWLDAQFPNLIRAADPEQLTGLAATHGITLTSALIDVVRTMFSHVGYLLTLAVLVPLYSFFFLVEFPKIKKAVHDHLPAVSRPTVVRVAQTIDRAVAAFFRGRLIVCTIVGLLAGLGWLIIGLKHSLLLGLLFGVLNLVPFLSLAALPPALIVAFITVAPEQSWVIPVVLTMGVYVTVQAIESFLLTPLIESKASGLHPVTTFVSLLIGGQIAGLLGMLLAIPIASTLKSLGIEYLLPEIRRLARESRQPPVTDAPHDPQPSDAESSGAQADSEPPAKDDETQTPGAE